MATTSTAINIPLGLFEREPKLEDKIAGAAFDGNTFKVNYQNQAYILEQDGWYTANGQRVNNPELKKTLAAAVINYALTKQGNGGNNGN